MNKENHTEDLEKLSLQHHHQFIQWLSNLIIIDKSLNIKYDSVYQDSYYIKLYELITEGIKYVNKEKGLSDKYPKEEANWYEFLSNELLNLRNEISETEFKYIQYKRHNSSHILQYDYEINGENGKIEKPKRNNAISNLNEILDIHGNYNGFDIYITKKLHPKIVEISNQSKEIINRHIMLILFS